MPPSHALAAWLARLERRHPHAIELGLERIAKVWKALGAPRPAPRVITVGGSNGKGSTAAFIEAAANGLGWRVGVYSSPHLYRYNERVRLCGADAADDDLVECFERIESVRGDTSLTYFETGTLAALLLMARAEPDLAVLEVGLGGRLDAVNLIDADVSVVTTVALDHQDWLGATRDLIGREKAGIARPGRALLVGEKDAAPALLERAAALGATVLRLGIDFVVNDEGPGRRLRLPGGKVLTLPAVLPLAGAMQWDNAATALAALAVLVPTLDLGPAASALAGARLPGRLQRLASAPEVVLDVGHNPQAAQALADWLAGAGAGTVTDAVFSALADKDLPGIVAPLLPRIRRWHLAGLDGPRGLTVEALAERLDGVLPADVVQRYDAVGAALHGALAQATVDERVLVFGSFHTVAEAGRALGTGL